MSTLSSISEERKSEIRGIIMLAVSAGLFLALATDSYQGNSNRPLTSLGTGGGFMVGMVYVAIGHAAHLLYFLVGMWGLMQLRHQPLDRIGTRVAGSVMLIVSVAGFLHVAFGQVSEPGGAVGLFFADMVQPYFGTIGAGVISVTLAAVGLLLATEFLFIRFLQSLYSVFMLVIRSVDELRNEYMMSMHARREEKARRAITVKAKATDAPERAQEPSGPGWMERLGSLLRTKKGKVRAAVAAAKSHTESVEVAINIHSDAPEPEYVSSEPDAEPEAFEVNIQVAPEVVEPVDQMELPDEDDYEDEEEDDDEEELDAEVVSEEPQTALVEVPKSPQKARLRRKNVIDEIPADYVYPKRYSKPKITMFEESPSVQHHDLTSQLRDTATLLEDTLKTFGIEAKVTDITRGPTLTRFELEPASGIKVARFIALTDDLALALKAQGVRVEAPIPGKGRVGIEIPNDEGEAVMIRELLTSKQFNKKKSQLQLALGKDIAGDVVAADLATMPHLLVAGATGAGKTVCVKTILASLLVSKSPDELQLMLIDPKMVELSIFNDIPHLITPVVIDPRKAATSLNWLITEMEERYKLFAHLRVRNIEVYNESVENGEIEIEGEDEDEVENMAVIRKLPYIVCIIDELADLMMLAKAEVEDSIARLAQLARAVGIHLIIATQRPSVDVLTGVIKANFPTRISFQVSSRVDSRCILDEIGAERLIGKGDMLYLPAGSSKPVRIQGAFVSDEDMNDLISHLKRQAPPQYRDEIENFGKKQEELLEMSDETDELFDDAVRVVTDTGQASISMVQRRLRVGYTRAARLIDMMEVKGIVGPHIGSKARDILVPSGGD
ncbi:MAG: DNA translocase FtsK [Candidatus Hydrogenedentota bacterium]